jgi:hypothetical protein
MKLSLRTVIIYGILLWIIPFIVSFIVFPTKSFFPPLFETIMAVTLTLCVVVLAILYFRRVTADYVRVGIVVGVVWLAISLLIDLPLFLFGGPMQMSFANYMMDIGLTYLIYPIVTIGFGYLLANKRGIT